MVVRLLHAVEEAEAWRETDGFVYKLLHYYIHVVQGSLFITYLLRYVFIYLLKQQSRL